MEEKNRSRNDHILLFSGIAGAVLLTLLIWVLGPWLSIDRVPHIPDQGPWWYYWKRSDPTLLTRLSAWGGYLLHQITFWILIGSAMRAHSRGEHAKVRKLAVASLLANGFFILLHILQTRLFYDGLAQDVHVQSSQISVIIVLVIILAIRNRDRGLFWGWKFPIPKAGTDFLMKWHGVYIAWALVYTFWFHPAEATPGHLLGFLYMFLLMVQNSLFYQKDHFNRIWTTFLELFVAFHGTMVAVMGGQAIWPMFAFGFLFLFVMTQVHGLGLKLPFRIGSAVLYVAAVIAVYSQQGFDKLWQVFAIPLIEYPGAILVAVVCLVPALLLGKKGVNSWGKEKPHG